MVSALGPEFGEDLGGQIVLGLANPGGDGPQVVTIFNPEEARTAAMLLFKAAKEADGHRWEMEQRRANG